MTITETTTDESIHQVPATAPLLIDTDVHEYMASKLDLLPYLSPYWQHYFTTHDLDKRPLIGSSFPYVVPCGDRREWRNEDGTRATELGKLRRQLFDEEGVSVAILNGFFHVSGMPGNYELATAMASAYNDWQIDQFLDKEPRLRGSVHVVARDPDSAAREIDRVAAHPQIVQVFLPLASDRLFGDPFYRPILEAAIRNDLVVTFHHGQHTETMYGYPPYVMEWKTVAPAFVGASQVLSLICNGAFDKYPELKVVLLETGVAWLPWLMWRADEQYRELRSEMPWVKRRPSEYMRDSLRVSTQPLSDLKIGDFVKLVEMTESERMFVFATDYPHFDADSADAVLTNAVPESLRNRIRYQNALETFPRLSATSV